MQKNLLGEIVIIRPILILSIVVGHAFAIYSGAWEAPEHVVHVSLYENLNPLFINFQLAAFVFVSGYLFGLKKNKVNETGFVMQKFKRLMIPALLFGLIYYFCFVFDKNEFSLFSCVVKLLGGIGHLWFLPMLFWCFVVTWLLRNCRINQWVLGVLLIMMSLLPLPIPLGIGNMLHYLIYFYAGVLIWSKKDVIIDKCLTLKIILPIGFVYFISLLAFLNSSLFFIECGDTLLIRGVNYLINCVVRFIVNISGIFLMYLIVVKFVNGGGKIYNWCCKANMICYGVYIVHQFILRYLYYETILPLKVEAIYLPWFVLVVTLGISGVLSVCMLKTRLGRYLIG